MKTFGQRFREILRRRGLTQSEAARLLETTQSAISYYCNLKKLPRRRILNIITERLGVSLAELEGERVDVVIANPPWEPVIPTPSKPVCKALDDLKRRWKRKHHERDTIRHLIAALFGDRADDVLAWFEGD